MKKILNNIMTIFLIITIILVSSTKSDKIFNITKFRMYTILTGSMMPKYNPGDVVLVAKTNLDKLDNNDVITFKINENTVTHRIVQKTDEGFITKGDNNNVNDLEVITKEKILGKVIFKIPKIGFILQILSTPYIVSIEMILMGLFILYLIKQ